MGVRLDVPNQSHEMQMLMNQVKQLQSKVMQLSNQQQQVGGGQHNNLSFAGAGSHRRHNMSTTYYNNEEGITNNVSSSGSSNSRSAHGVRRNNMNERSKAPIAPNGKRKILLVSNLPPVLANPDSVYYMFVKLSLIHI